MERFLNGEFDMSDIQDYELHFFHALHPVAPPPPDKEIWTPILPYHVQQYFSSIRKNTVTGVTSGRHMGMYKALCTSLEDPDTSKQQEQILEGVVCVLLYFRFTYLWFYSETVTG